MPLAKHIQEPSETLPAQNVVTRVRPIRLGVQEMNPEVLTADPKRDLTVRAPHLQPHRERRIRSSRVRFHHLRVLVHDTSVIDGRDNGMSVFLRATLRHGDRADPE
jgi:hypothetical protein